MYAMIRAIELIVRAVVVVVVVWRITSSVGFLNYFLRVLNL